VAGGKHVFSPAGWWNIYGWPVEIVASIYMVYSTKIIAYNHQPSKELLYVFYMSGITAEAKETNIFPSQCMFWNSMVTPLRSLVAFCGLSLGYGLVSQCTQYNRKCSNSLGLQCYNQCIRAHNRESTNAQGHI
jgi:hypothetical protein